jgi:extracellular elastinolytic metalloproteinase
VNAICHANGVNNAAFLTLPDGESPFMEMFIWDYTRPRKDSAMDFGVVAHEYTHGVSNRLTGGPSSIGCLSGRYSGGK